MSPTGMVTLLLIAANVLFSYRGFNNIAFYEKHKFEVDRILVAREYRRLITSGFLHNGWVHLIFNMISLYAFSGIMEMFLGTAGFLVVYFAGLVGGNAVALLLHRQHGDYSAVGASGAVCGIIFGGIALFPGMGMSLFLIPFSLPAWIFGLLFLVYTLFAVRSGGGTAHEAHLGGALAGMLVTLLFAPGALSQNLPVIALLAIPAIAGIFFFHRRPYALVTGISRKKRNHYSIDHRYNEEKAVRQQEVDRILDKINRHGIKTLTKEERQTLDAYAQSIR